MPTKGKSKRSNAKKTSNNRTIMKWWFVIPVVLFVSIVGYAIVRFAEARPTSGTIMRSGRAISAVNYTSKGDGITAASTPAKVSFSRAEIRNKKRLCVTFYGLGARSRVGNATPTYAKVLWRTTKSGNHGWFNIRVMGKNTWCDTKLRVRNKLSDVEVLVEKVGSGSLYVSQIYLK